MDTRFNTAEALLSEARRKFESFATHAAPDIATPARQLLDQLQLVPKSEVDRLRRQINELESRVAELETRLSTIRDSGQ